jgi:hypothetical protein
MARKRRVSDRRPLIGIGDDVEFEIRLAQVIAWCTPRIDLSDPGGSLRSDQLRPRILEVDRAGAVAGVAGNRAAWNSDVWHAKPIHGVEGLRGGRLLAFFPDESLSDGAAESETGGFFDVDNTPPWDAWVALFRNDSAFPGTDLLVTWVPAELLETVERGIRVNPEGCIVWLADSRTSVAEKLKERSLLA